jgi:hypothetical protein
MTTQSALVTRVRAELGDFGEPFQDTFLGTGDKSQYDFVEERVTGVSVLAVTSAGSVTLTEGTHYSIDYLNGTIFLMGAYAPLPTGTTLVINGQTWGMLTDDEISAKVNDAFMQHTSGAHSQSRVKDAQTGFIEYIDLPLSYETLPGLEEQLVVLLATIECLWMLATDASTDANINTADGTSVDRTTRYAQIRNQIDVLDDKYKKLCSQLNVGLYRIEVAELRRISRTTGRLVPVYRPREYDDHEYPIRILPPIDERNRDTSGISDPAWGGPW